MLPSVQQNESRMILKGKGTSAAEWKNEESVAFVVQRGLL